MIHSSSSLRLVPIPPGAGAGPVATDESGLTIRRYRLARLGAPARAQGSARSRIAAAPRPSLGR